MINFNDVALFGSTQVMERVSPVIVETVTVTALPSGSESRAYLTKPDDQWTWSDLRDYVVSQIERMHGRFPRDSKREYGIFNRFMNEHGVLAPAIARYAFEVCQGMWVNAPISVYRFTKNCDPYFATPIKERIASTPEPIQGW